MKYILVDTISQYRMRYLVEAEQASHALDVVTEEQAKEFSQLHLGEVIISSREVTLDEALAQFRADHDYLASWTDEQCLNASLTRAEDYQ